MRQGLEARRGAVDRLAPARGRRIVAECTTIDEAIVRTAVYWLAAEAARSRLDAIIVMPSGHEHQALACALPSPILQDLIDGKIVRMNRESLQLMAPHEVMPQVRQHPRTARPLIGAETSSTDLRSTSRSLPESMKS